jgi:hypothetical protein
MANRVRRVALTDEQRAVLQRPVKRKGAPARVVERAHLSAVMCGAVADT